MNELIIKLAKFVGVDLEKPKPKAKYDARFTQALDQIRKMSNDQIAFLDVEQRINIFRPIWDEIKESKSTNENDSLTIKRFMRYAPLSPDYINREKDYAKGMAEWLSSNVDLKAFQAEWADAGVERRSEITKEILEKVRLGRQLKTPLNFRLSENSGGVATFIRGETKSTYVFSKEYLEGKEAEFSDVVDTIFHETTHEHDNVVRDKILEGKNNFDIARGHNYEFVVTAFDAHIYNIWHSESPDEYRNQRGEWHAYFIAGVAKEEVEKLLMPEELVLKDSTRFFSNRPTKQAEAMESYTR